MNLNPLIAKLKPNGNVHCLVCGTEVKSKIWTAHLNGKKHRENIDKLKAQSVKKREKQAGREFQEEPPAKKQKDNPKEGPTTIPDDFFDSGKPFRKDDSKMLVGNSSDMIEGLPKGFFDDKRMDDRVRDTREKNAILDEEFKKWQEEISEEQVDREAQEEEQEAADQRELELERIDEQMAALKRLNEMEIRKEKRLHQAKERRRKREEADDGGEEDPVDDVDIDGLDWRAKDIFS